MGCTVDIFFASLAEITFKALEFAIGIGFFVSTFAVFVVFVCFVVLFAVLFVVLQDAKTKAINNVILILLIIIIFFR